MDELNDHESDNLATLIELVLNLAKWLWRALFIIGLLELASLVSLLNGPVLFLMLALVKGYVAGIVITICVLVLFACYYVDNCVSQQLKRYSERAKKTDK